MTIALAIGVGLPARVCQACEYLHARRDRRCVSWQVGTFRIFTRTLSYTDTDGYRSLSASSAAADIRRHTLCRDIIRRLYVSHVRARICVCFTRRGENSPPNFLLGQVEPFRCFNERYTVRQSCAGHLGPRGRNPTQIYFAKYRYLRRSVNRSYRLQREI